VVLNSTGRRADERDVPPRDRPQRKARSTWVRYVVPIRLPEGEGSTIDVFSPPGDPQRAAVCATIVAQLPHPRPAH
jgi:hypothetical protein